MKKFLFVLLIVCLMLSQLACSISDAIMTLLFGNTQPEKQAGDYIQDTCRKRPDGTCKIMGEK